MAGMLGSGTPGTVAPAEILVVDDDPQIVRLVRTYMEQAGFHVTTADDGEAALHAIRANRPDIVILDLMLPGRDGLSVTQIIRADAELASLPILMLTARVDDIDRILGLELGADDYVTKPFHPREVVARVKAILRRSQTVSSTPERALHVGEILLDPNAHSVVVANHLLQLTPSEFAILHLFLRTPGHLFSRAQIIEDALGYDYEGLDRAVDSHIKNLRRKLDRTGQQSVELETVFGLGYRLTVIAS
jgi:two-component system alkaline phosphatase synthesis response regulator PhoP